MTPPETAKANPYLTGTIPALFLKTASPIIFLMIMNGLFTVVDALFLGLFVGADALAAVTLMFPLFMFIIAITNLVSTGMASVLARHLGAGNMEEAKATLMSAHLLILIVSALLIAVFLVAGKDITRSLAGGNADLADMGYTYISVMVFASPLAFALALQSDAFRSEGMIREIAVIGIASTVLNIAFNYVLIRTYGLGVLGSALGTALTQFLVFTTIAILRLRGAAPLPLFSPLPPNQQERWRTMLALGAPAALNFAGVSLTSAAIILQIPLFAGINHTDTAAAYGIITRVSGFTFLPMLGLNLATQSILGNNYGAGNIQRTNEGLAYAMRIILVYTLVIQAVMILNAEAIGAMFVTDPAVIAEVKRILPVTFATLFIFGQTMIIAGYFQALGDAKRAALFGLGKIYLFTLPLIATLPRVMGDWGLWFSTPAADLAMLLLASGVLLITYRNTGARFGLFLPENSTARAFTSP